MRRPFASGIKWRVLKVIRVSARIFNAHSTITASYVCPPAIPSFGARRSKVRYIRPSSATGGEVCIKLASKRRNASDGDRRCGAGSRVNTAYASTKAGATATNRSSRSNRRSSSATARAWCSCQEQMAATMQLVSATKTEAISNERSAPHGAPAVFLQLFCA